MARWDSFVSEVDIEREKQLKRLLNVEKDILKTLESGLKNKYLFWSIEPYTEQV